MRGRRFRAGDVARRTTAVLLVVLAAAMFSAVARAAKAATATWQRAAVTTTSLQRIDGFGASGAWWPNDVVDFTPAAQEQIGALLFGRAGIALSSYRFNIGAGGSLSDPVRETQSFLVRPGVWDWTRDPGGMRFLRLAHDYRVPTITGFANSAPPFWTTNRRVCGGRLVAADQAAYAAYLARVATHLRRAEGITLSYLSPMNEPDASFAGCGQEGMAVRVSRRASLVGAVRRALGFATPTRVLADESSLLGTQLVPEAPGWAPEAGRSLGALAHHGYDYPDGRTFRRAASLATRLGKPLRMTETCCFDGRGFGPDYDPTMGSGLWLANTIWQALAQGNETGFDWWTALSPELGCDPAALPACPEVANGDGWNDGLLYYDGNFRQDGNEQVYVTKRYWVLGNFSRYVRPGSVRHQVVESIPGVRLLASHRLTRWTVIAIDNRAPGSAGLSLRVELPLVPANRLGVLQAFQTGASSDLTPVGPPRTDAAGTGFFIHLPSQSVTTVVAPTVKRG